VGVGGRGSGGGGGVGWRNRTHRFSLGEPEIKRPLRRPKHRGEDNIKMDIKEMVPKDVK